MKIEARWQQAADQIWSLWQAGDIFDGLGADHQPASRADGYAIQSCLEQRTGQPIFGWKIAATSAAGQQHIGVDGPIAGRLLAERCHDNGATVPFGRNRMAVAEPEFAFQLGRDAAPREGEYSIEDCLDHVADLYPAIEIPDSRFADFASVGAANLIADNACAHEFVLGPRVTADWRRLDLAAFQMRAEIVGKMARDGIGSNVLGDPRTALAWLINEVTGLGLTLRAGQVITTGTCAIPLEIEAGDQVHMDFAELGQVDVTFA